MLAKDIFQTLVTERHPLYKNTVLLTGGVRNENYTDRFNLLLAYHHLCTVCPIESPSKFCAVVGEFDGFIHFVAYICKFVFNVI